MAEISKSLEEGALIIYPTETLYGIGCDALAPGDPMGKIARLKRRQAERPFIFLVPDIPYLEENGISIPPAGQRLMERFWPGPLTLILPVPPASPLAGIAFQGGLAVRVSPHPFVRTLFRHRRFPLVSTSANLSGAPEDNARDPGKIEETFSGTTAFFINAGPLPVTPPSTLVNMCGSSLELVREGKVSFMDIAMISSLC